MESKPVRCNQATNQTCSNYNYRRPKQRFRPKNVSMALFKSKYKRLVDHIYVKGKHKNEHQVTLDNNKISTLIYYSSNYPEKATKMINYLRKKILYQVKKKKIAYVDVSLQAMDVILASSTGQTYNLYAEHFLIVVAVMLETDDYDMQQLATTSLIKFADIKEETFFYHGCYEPLIVEYSAMCNEKENRKKILGARGLYAIVRKIYLQDLAENIWKPVHMDKIISALLCCMAQFTVTPSRENIALETSGQEAEKCMSLLMSTASFGQVVSVLNSVYNYTDEFNLWGETLFVDYIYNLIMNSIQSRYWPTIVINGISRLQQQVNAPVSTRRNQLKVFCTMLSLMKNQALGSLTFDYLNFLFSEIPRITLEGKAADSPEMAYAQDLMDCLESVATCLAEYETLEVMVFIVNKITDTEPEAVMRDVMFRCLYTLTLNYNNRFPMTMYNPLLQLMQDPTTVVMGQTVFYTLLDLNGNLATINMPTYGLTLRTMPFCRPNENFIQNHDLEIYRALLKSLFFENVSSAHVVVLYRTLAVMAAYQDPNIVLRFIACVIVMQNIAIVDGHSPENRFMMLIGALALLKVVAKVTAITKLEHYAKELATHRDHAKWHSDTKYLVAGERVPECCLISEVRVCELIADRSEDTVFLTVILNEMKDLKELLLNNAPLKDRETTSNSIIVDSKSWSSSRLFEDRSTPNDGNTLPEELRFEAMKAVLAEPIEETRKKMAQRQEELKNKYQNSTLPDIMKSLYNEDEDELRKKVSEIINSETKLDPKQNEQPLSAQLEDRFPDIFY